MNDEAFDRMKAPLVGYLTTGLDKMREAAGAAGTPSPPGLSGNDSYDKMLEHGDYASPQPELTDYDEIDPKMEGLRNDPAFQRAGLQGYGSGVQAGVAGMGHDGGVGAGASVTSLGGGSGGDGAVKKSGGKRAQIWDRLRSGGK